MFNDHRVVVVLPAYNASTTLEKTHREITSQSFVDDVILVDDGSVDDTVRIANGLNSIRVVEHEKNRGYGANQKTCYRTALEAGADIVVMVHPDYQYTPKLIPAMVSLIGSGLYDSVLASRILGGRAVEYGMPRWRYVPNRVITFLENLLMGAKLSEYHTGYRAFSADALRRLNVEVCSDDFVFDNEIIAQMIWMDMRIAEVTCPARYESESSSIDFSSSIRYGLGCLLTAAKYRVARTGVFTSRLFSSLE
jgi:glycosyltransferase involved in cell wall biosynthesis